VDVSETVAGLRAQVGDVMTEAQVVEKALEMARARVGAARAQASRKMGDELRPEHGAAVQRIVETLRTLSAALEAEKGLRDNLKANGYAEGCLPAHGYRDADLSDPCSQSSYFLRGAAAAGYLERADS